jgi:hypothetical protein
MLIDAFPEFGISLPSFTHLCLLLFGNGIFRVDSASLAPRYFIRYSLLALRWCLCPERVVGRFGGSLRTGKLPSL